MIETAERFPLSWPAGWPRTLPRRRRVAQFSKSVRVPVEMQGGSYTRKGPLTVADALTRLSGELDRLGATGPLLSTNVPVRLDGRPRSGQAEPDDPGAAVYFRLEGRPRCLACDRWTRVADNIAALAQHIDALRRIDRYGVGTMAQAFAGYAQLTTGADPWWTVLGVAETATLDEIEEVFRMLAKRYHPDVGGDHAAMARLTTARDTARALHREDTAGIVNALRGGAA